jgi:hypothetical protein
MTGTFDELLSISVTFDKLLSIIGISAILEALLVKNRKVFFVILRQGVGFTLGKGCVVRDIGNFGETDGGVSGLFITLSKRLTVL